MQADNSMTQKFGGTGLGLALSQRLSLVLCGEMSIPESKLGVGSVTTIVQWKADYSWPNFLSIFTPRLIRNLWGSSAPAKMRT